MVETLTELERKVSEFRSKLLDGKNFIKYNDFQSHFDNFLKYNLEELTNFTISSGDPKALVLLSEMIAQGLKVSGVSMNQLRNIFGYVKKIETGEILKTDETISKDTYIKLGLLSPKMAYLVGRERKPGLKLLKDITDKCIEKIERDRKKFKNFINFFEAIVSYFKYYNPK